MGEEKLPTDQEFSGDALKEIFDAVNRYYHKATITAVTGTCPYGHCAGETFKLTGMNHDCLCGSLFQALQASLITLEYGGGVPWENDPSVFSAACPEGGRVKVEVKRFEQEKPVFVKTKTDSRDMTGKGLPFLDKYRVFLEVIGREHVCMWGHKPGERFEVDPYNIGKVCGALYRTAYPFIVLLYTGGRLPWEGDDNTVHGVCPDPYDLVSYRLVREER